MTTTTNTPTLAQAMQVRCQQHNEANLLLSQIEAAQTAIEEHQSQINKLNIAASYYRPLADFHAAQIEKQTAIRNKAVRTYENTMWNLYRASLPIFSTTGVQEIAVTLYSSHTVQA